jgi:hypothetical protein
MMVAPMHPADSEGKHVKKKRNVIPRRAETSPVEAVGARAKVIMVAEMMTKRMKKQQCHVLQGRKEGRNPQPGTELARGRAPPLRLNRRVGRSPILRRRLKCSWMKKKSRRTSSPDVGVDMDRFHHV